MDDWGELLPDKRFSAFFVIWHACILQGTRVPLVHTSIYLSIYLLCMMDAAVSAYPATSIKITVQ